MNFSPLHTFHIPVMGLAYTIDSPIKVARYGIDSVISIIEDRLVELMRRHYCTEYKQRYEPITQKEDDYRARRITAYLNLVNKIVKEQLDSLRNTAFAAGSEISKYFEMLPNDNVLRIAYDTMMHTSITQEKEALMTWLRNQVRPGRIDVNIMTKVDKNNFHSNGNLIPDSSDALAALRGYAESDLRNSSIVFSAGLNPRLFNYMEKLSAFKPVAHAMFDKNVIVKVSDYRSAIIQGKYLAKKGIWVSEFRIESGLNCGGHAFTTDGSLLGPILQEFKDKKDELISALHVLYNPAAQAKGWITFDDPHPINITVQGGIGTYEEAQFLLSQYGVSSTGWGTPFLLCPEATTVDNETLALLRDATEDDIVLSKNSPLGIRFNYLRNTSAEKEKLLRIVKGKPGSPCTEKHLVSNTEFSSEPICTASHTYQKQKIAQLKTLDLPLHVYEKQFNEVVAKECLCMGLTNAAIHKYDLPPVKKLVGVTVCPGPNIAYFNKVVSLREMTDHIYGRKNVLLQQDRPHMFLKELSLNIGYLKEQADELKPGDLKQQKAILDFSKQLLLGIDYYYSLADVISDEEDFTQQLFDYQMRIAHIQEKIVVGCPN